MRLYSRDGSILIEVTKLERRGDDLAIQGKMLGTMPLTAHVRPEEAWAIFRIISWDVLRYLPLFFSRGWRRNREKPGA